MKLIACVGLVAVAAGCGDNLSPPGIEPPAGELFDPLSMPVEPTLDLDSFAGADQCGRCHVQHYAEWRTSNHGYAMADPVYRALVRERQRAFDGLQDRFCLQCHSAIGTRGGDIQRNFSFDELAPITLEGITCESCHKVESVARTFNSGHVFDADGPVRGTIQDPVDNNFHEAAYSELHSTADFCGGCHDIIEVNGLNLERPFEEWKESPANSSQPCQSCHMPTYTGSATTGTPERTLHRHRWVGVDVPMADGFVTEAEAEQIRSDVADLLNSSATITLDSSEAVAGDTVNLFVTVANNIPAHNFPTGSTFIRQAWVEVTVRDADGELLYQTGHLDSNGDLRNFFSEDDPFGDPDLLMLSSGLIDESGTPVVFTWDATEHISGSLSPLYQRTNTLFIPTEADTPGPIEVTARIRFRAFAPYLLRTLGLDEYLDKLEIFDVDSATLSIPVVGP